MLRFEWTFADDAEEITGLTLGDLTLRGDLGELSSKGRTPDQSCMVFASIPDALRGVQQLLTHPRQREFVYRGIGCNFGFEVRRVSGGRELLWVSAMDLPIAETTGHALAVALAESVRECMQRHPLDPGDIALDDLLDARVDFEEMTKGLTPRP